MKDPRIKRAIKERQDSPLEVSLRSAIADRHERQAFWTAIMRGRLPQELAAPPGAQPIVPVQPTLADRLKASELLGRSCADFVDVQKGDNKMNISIKKEIISREVKSGQRAIAEKKNTNG